MPSKTPAKSGPPHNPGVRELVANLRRSHTPPDRKLAKQGFAGWHERGYLPHFDAPGLTQFVTFGLDDSLPPRAWEQIRNADSECAAIRALHLAFDEHHGACRLRIPEVAGLVEAALLHFHGERYELRGWCVMPNHVHVLVRINQVPLREILHSWKSFSAREANRFLDRAGNAFWHEDYFDRYARDAEHEVRILHYIERNPCKARLVCEPHNWRWSSARFRNANGKLAIPQPGGPAEQGEPRTAAILAAAAPPTHTAPEQSELTRTSEPLRAASPRSSRNQPALRATYDSQTSPPLR